MLAYSLRYGRRLAIPPLDGNDLPKRPPCVGINQLMKSSHDPPHSRGCPHRVGIPASWPMARLQKIIDEWWRGQEGCRRKHIRYQQWALYESAGSIQFWPSESVAPSGRAPGKGIRALYKSAGSIQFWPSESVAPSGRAPGKGIRALYKSASSIQFWPSESVAPSGRAPGKVIRALFKSAGSIQVWPGEFVAPSGWAPGKT